MALVTQRRLRLFFSVVDTLARGIGLLIGRRALLNLPQVGKPESFAADPPGAALDFLDKDPGIGPDGFADVGNNGLSDIRDDLARLVLREFTFKYLDSDDWHDEVLLKKEQA
jgi:hypothetical protein